MTLTSKSKGKTSKKKAKPAGDLRARFAEEYAIDHNGTQAAIRAGYSPKSAAAAASRMLKLVNVASKVNTLDAEKSQRTAITADRVLQEYESLAMVDIIDIFNANGTMKPLDKIPEAARRAIAGIEIMEEFQGKGDERTFLGYTKKLKLTDKKGALDSLAKIMGLMRDGAPPVQVNLAVSQENRISLDSLPLDLVRQMRDHLRDTMQPKVINAE
jgi:phage terminase small subunit